MALRFCRRRLLLGDLLLGRGLGLVRRRAIPGGGLTGGSRGLLGDTGALAAQAAQIIELGPPHVAAVARTVAQRGAEAAAVARRLQAATSIRRASPLVAQLRLLTYQLAEGGDLNGDGELSLDGEAGLQQLEAHVYLILEGEGLPRMLR